MVIELVKGVALLLALRLMQSVNIRFWRKHNIAGQVSAGILFGAICVAGMMMPIVVAPGVIFDARSIVLSMAGMFGDALVGGVAALIAAGYRVWLGGAGVTVGITVALASVILGLLYRYAVGKGWVKIGVVQLLLFGLLVHVLVALLFTQLPADIAEQVLANVSLPLLLTFAPATPFLGLLLQDGVRQNIMPSQLLIHITVE